jgi:hypothetical protein
MQRRFTPVARCGLFELVMAMIVSEKECSLLFCP